VTRDRLVAPAAHAGRTFLCVDTGGFLAETSQDRGTLVAQVRGQTLAAIEQADCVVCVFDAQSGLGPADREMVDVLRRSGKPTLFVAQKIDTPRHEPLVSEFYAAVRRPRQSRSRPSTAAASPRSATPSSPHCRP